MRPPPFIDAATIDRLLDYPSLIARIRQFFEEPPVAPERQAIELSAGASASLGTLLIMPALGVGGLAIVKLVTVHPHLADRPRGALSATLVALSSTTGDVVGIVDGHALTARRTAATSVLAAKMLARPEATRLLIVGAGAVARALAEAYAAASGVREVAIWARRPEAADRLAAELRSIGVAATSSPDLTLAARQADIVSTATLATRPLLMRDMIAPGAHLDLVGGFAREMCEADPLLVAAARVVVDGPAAIAQAGDLAGPLAAGLLDAGEISTLSDLLRTPRPRGDAEVTVFKSIGMALEDLAASELLFERLGIQLPPAR